MDAKTESVNVNPYSLGLAIWEYLARKYNDPELQAPPIDFALRPPGLSSRHVCNDQCGNGRHVLEFEVSPTIAKLLAEPLSPAEERIYALMGRVAWEVATPDELKELDELLSSQNAS